MKNLKLFLPLLIFVLLALFLLKGLERDPTELPSALVGKPVPDFSLPDLEAPDRMLDASVFEGEVTLLNVWGTWCVACRDEHPFLMDLADEGVRLVGVNYKDDRAAALRWLVDRGDPYAFTIADPDGILGLNLGVYGAPETYLIDSDGVVRARHVGVVNAQVWQDLGARYAALKSANQ